MPPDRPRSSRFRLPAFLLAFLVLTAVGIATVLGVRGLDASNQLVAHTYEVLNAIEQAQSQLRAVETSARGYRLSGNDSLRQSYVEGVPFADELLAQLGDATSGDPRQHRRALEFQTVATAQLQELQRLLEIQEDGGIAAAQAAMRVEDSVSRARHAGRLADEMRNHELRLLEQRQAQGARSGILLLGFVVLGIALSLGLVGFLVRGLARENRRSRALEREARSALVQLREANTVGERLSEQRRALGVYSGFLQSCHSRDEAITLAADTLHHLLPDAGGRCYAGGSAGEVFHVAATFGKDLVGSSDLLRHEECWALRRAQPHLNDGRPGSMRCAHLDPGTTLAGISTYCFPLAAQGTSLGLLHVNAPAVTCDADIQLIESMAEQLAMAMSNLQLRETLRAQSLRDGLTGLFNRRHLEASLEHELLRCAQRGLPLSLLMLDVDHFKRFNDEHGHAAGDAVLAHVGRTLQAMVRDGDLACRYGGEEFTVVLPETGLQVALGRAEAIRAAVASSTLQHLRKPLDAVTASIGVAAFPADGSTQQTLFAAADAALYRAKAQGRNRVIHFGLPG